MVTYRDPAVQCRDEVTRIVRALSRIGLSPGDALGKEPISEAAHRLTDTLAGDDKRAANRTYTALMGLLWSHGDPEQVGHPEWWSTPLGLLCARVAAEDESVGVSYTTAATMLGVSKGTVSQQLSRDKASRKPGPSGGPFAANVYRSWVLRRLLSRAA